ncbi:MAG: hypothetical protein KIT75_13220 [Planctomycetota bacterium]|nr:hypothetical protein [Planctomycetota bacterium]
MNTDKANNADLCVFAPLRDAAFATKQTTAASSYVRHVRHLKAVNGAHRELGEMLAGNGCQLCAAFA